MSARAALVPFVCPFMSTPAPASAHVVTLPMPVMPTVSASPPRALPSLPNKTADNIVWGTVSGDDTIVRGAMLDDTIVWGSSLDADTTGWGASLSATF